jgi:hypothetical protein
MPRIVSRGTQGVNIGDFGAVQKAIAGDAAAAAEAGDSVSPKGLSSDVGKQAENAGREGATHGADSLKGSPGSAGGAGSSLGGPKAFSGPPGSRGYE